MTVKKKPKKIETKKEPVSEKKPIDFSFKAKDVGEEIDAALNIRKKQMGQDEFKIEHVSDRIKFAKTIKEEPPEKKFLAIDTNEAVVEYEDEYGQTKKEKGIAVISYHEQELASDPTKPPKIIKKIAVYNGIFSIDLNTDAYFWFVRACNIFPLILDQGIRTHLDIKKSHEPEKRKTEIPIWLIGLIITGAVFIFLMFNFLMKG